MIERYLVAELEVIEEDERKLFYCEKENFKFTSLTGYTLNYTCYEMRIFFDGMLFAVGEVTEVGTHGAEMRFVWYQHAFNSQKQFGTQKIFAKDFAVGDKIVFETVFKEDILKKTIQELIELENI